MKLNKGSEIGIALGGGAVLGAVHIGVIKAFEEHDIKIQCISGTSIGALIASLYACGLDGVAIEKLLTKQSWFDISQISLSRFGILSNQKLGKFVDKHSTAKAKNLQRNENKRSTDGIIRLVWST